MRLRCLDGDLPHIRTFELGQERVPRWSFMNDRRIAEADVYHSRSTDSVERTVQYLYAVLLRLRRARLHVGLVDLDNIGARSEQVLDLLVDRRCVVHGELDFV